MARHCTYNATMRRVRVTTVAVEKQCVTYSKCAVVALAIQYAMRMRHTVICQLSRSTMFFPHYLTKGKVLEKKLLYWKSSKYYIFSVCLQTYVHSTQCACAILLPAAYPALQYFSTFSHKRHRFFGKKVTEHKICVLIVSTAFV
jgi:hypothetical protein